MNTLKDQKIEILEELVLFQRTSFEMQADDNVVDYLTTQKEIMGRLSKINDLIEADFLEKYAKPIGDTLKYEDVELVVELLEAEIDSCKYEYKHGLTHFKREYSQKILSYKKVLKAIVKATE